MTILNELRDHAHEIRTLFSNGGLTGEQRNRYTDELVRFETQIANGTWTPIKTRLHISHQNPHSTQGGLGTNRLSKIKCKRGA
mgnify:FL=1